VTPLILEHYIQTIRVMKLLDPSTMLLEIISEPIKSYLRKRKDTARCIVQSILADEDSELYEQLGQQYTRIPLRVKQHSKQPEPEEDEDEDEYVSSDEDEEAAEQWEPFPLNKEMIGYISAKSKRSDIISTLVNIFGSQDKFLEVYKSMLEERILAGGNFSFETELKNLELLKIRFGESNLHACDVMLKDIKESERINGKIKQGSQPPKPGEPLDLHKFGTLILSKGFWEQVKGEDGSTGFTVPPFLKEI